MRVYCAAEAETEEEDGCAGCGAGEGGAGYEDAVREEGTASEWEFELDGWGYTNGTYVWLGLVDDGQ
jgi:hypothetical protein